MGFFGKIIGCAIAETANTVVKSGMEERKKDKKIKREQQNFDSLETLKALYDSKAITKKEYQKKKKEILSRY